MGHPLLATTGIQPIRIAPPSPSPQGLVFAVGAERGVVKLYDARNWAAGPFTSFPVGTAALDWPL